MFVRYCHAVPFFRVMPCFAKPPTNDDISAQDAPVRVSAQEQRMAIGIREALKSLPTWSAQCERIERKLMLALSAPVADLALDLESLRVAVMAEKSIQFATGNARGNIENEVRQKLVHAPACRELREQLLISCGQMSEVLAQVRRMADETGEFTAAAMLDSECGFQAEGIMAMADLTGADARAAATLLGYRHDMVRMLAEHNLVEVDAHIEPQLHEAFRRFETARLDMDASTTLPELDEAYQLALLRYDAVCELLPLRRGESSAPWEALAPTAPPDDDLPPSYDDAIRMAPLRAKAPEPQPFAA